MAGSALLFPTFLVLSLVHFDFQGGRGILVVQSSTVCLLFPYFSYRLSYVFFGNGELGYFEQRLFGSDGPSVDLSCDLGGCFPERCDGFLWVATWTLRILSGISEGICNTMVQSGGEFLYIGVGGR